MADLDKYRDVKEETMRCGAIWQTRTQKKMYDSENSRNIAAVPIVLTNPKSNCSIQE